MIVLSGADCGEPRNRMNAAPSELARESGSAGCVSTGWQIDAIRAARFTLILLAFAMGGCITLKKPPVAATEAPVCASDAMAECDVTNPGLPPASDLSADYAMDLAKFHQRQRDECAALNRAKAACLNPQPKRGKR